jgi:hypothetical protein
MEVLRKAQSVELNAAEALALMQRELDQANQELASGRLDSGLDRCTLGLGLALQLGPAPLEHALAAILASARALALSGDADALSALGPAVIDLVEQVRSAGALPPTEVMAAWATVAADLGALLGHLGLALSIPATRRRAVLTIVRGRARLLDEATGELFQLARLLDGISTGE